jgi:hypothetical protein
MANQITPKAMLTLQLHDWKVLLAQLEANPDTPAADIIFCQAKVQQIEREINDLTIQ